MPRRNAPRQTRRRVLIAAAALLALTLASPVGADVILLKNGGRLEGVIVEETEAAVRIRIRGGELTIKRSKIRKIKRKSEDTNEALKKRQETEEDTIAADDKARKPKAAPPKQDAAAEPLGDLRGKLGETIKIEDGRSRFSITLPAGWKRVSKGGETLSALRPGPTGRLDLTLLPTRGQSLGRLGPRLAREVKKRTNGFKEVERSQTRTASGAGRFLLIYEFSRGKQAFMAMTAWFDSGRPFKYALSFFVPKELYEDLKKALTKSLESFTPVL